MPGLEGDSPLRGDDNGFPVNRAFADVAQDEPEIKAEPGFEKELHAFNLFKYLSRSDVTWNPSVTSVCKASLFCPTTEEYILPIIHGNDRVEWFVQLSDEITWEVERSRDRPPARPRDHEGRRRRRDAGRHPPPGLLQEALDAAGVGERHAADLPKRYERGELTPYGRRFWKDPSEQIPGDRIGATQLNHANQLFIDGEFVDVGIGLAHPGPQSARQLADHRGRGSAEGRHRPGGRRSSEGLSGVGANGGDGPRAPAAQAGGCDRSQRRGAGADSRRLDTGHPLRDTRGLDVARTAVTFRYFGGMADKFQGSVVPVEQGFLNYVLRQPVGVVGQIVPWNFPLMFTSWKMGPALAAGNTVVMKPAELTPLSSLRIAELAREVGFPKGVMNIVPGYGNVAGQYLAEHPGVDKIAFTGSTAIGRKIVQASAGNLKRVQLELGGKGANIVFDDANLIAAVNGSAFAIFHNQGQACIAGSRLMLHEKIADAFLDRFLTLARSIKLGNPLEPSTEMGPLTSTQHRDRVLSYVQGRAARRAARS